jgi:WD40 repeat protein
MSLDLQSCLSCNCGPVSVVDNDTIVYMVANSVVLWNVVQNSKHFIWHNSLGITTCAANSRSNLIAIGEEGTDPRVAIYNYPQKTLIRSLNGGATVMYTALAFSRTGDRLVTVGDYPSYTLRVWEKDKMLISVNLLKEPMKLIVHDSILILLKHEVKILNLYQSFEVPPDKDFNDQKREIMEKKKDISDLKKELIEKNRYSTKTFTLTEIIPLDAVFDKYGHIYLSTSAGELLVLKNDLKETKVIQRFEYKIISMVLTHRYLIIATSENKLQWLNVFIPPEENDPRTGKNMNLKVYKELTLEDHQDIIQLMYISAMTKLLMIGAQGKLQLLNLPADLSFEVDDDEEEKEDEEDQVDDEDEEETYRKPKVVAVSPQLIGQYHVGSIKQLVGLGDSTQAASIAEDLRIWEVVTGENLMQYSSPDEVEYTSIDANIPGNLIFVGSASGAVRVFDVSNRMVARLVTLIRLSEHSIDHVLISPDQRLVACGSNQTNEIFFLEGSVNSKFRMIGHVNLPGKVLSFCWYNKQIIALLYSSLLVSFDPPKVDCASSIDPLPVSLKHKHVAEGTSICVYNSRVYLAGAAKDLYIYALPDQDIAEIDLRKLPPEPLDICPVDKVNTSVLSLSPNLKTIAVGCVDGSVKIIDLQSGPSIGKQIHGSSGVQSLNFSADSSLLFSTGHERDFFCWNLVGKLIDRPTLSSQAEDPSLESLETVQDLSDTSVVLAKNIIAEAKAKSEAKEIERVKSKLKTRMQEIQDKLFAMLKANEKAPELEKLDRDEFVLDLQAKKKIEEKGREAATALKEEAKKKNLAQELLQQRIKIKTLDSMEVNSRVLSSFLTDQIVYNYTIRKLTPDETTKFKKIRSYRAIELKEQLLRKENGQEEIINYEDFAVNWIIGKTPEDWKNHPLLISLDKKRESARKEGDLKPINEWELIYPAPLIYTLPRKRIQIFLLSMLCRAFKEGFNSEFEKLETFKDRQIDLIEEKNTLIIEKQKELNAAINVFKHKVNILEDPIEMLKVKDSDFTVEKYLSKEEREANEEKRKKEEERIRLLNADDSKKKALIQMMNGTIENKKNNLSLLSEKLVREEWMDRLTVNEMTEDQRQKLKEFEEKDKKSTEEREKLKKILEGELKKLQGEVSEYCKGFDNKVRELFLLRLDTDYEIYQMELMMARLSLSILSDEKRKEEINVLQAKKEVIEEDLKKNDEEILGLDKHIQKLQNTIENYQTDAKVLENHFKSTLEKEATPGVDQNKIKNLFKFGPEKKQKNVNNPEVDEFLATLNPLDPYTTLEKKKIESSQPPPPNRELEEKDIPKDTPDAIIVKLIDARKKKLEYEKQIPQIQAYIKEVDTHKKWNEKKKQKLQEKLKVITNELESKKQENIKQKFNTELLLKLKQALVEVPQQPVVTDYSDAILIHKNVVETKNKAIREIGGQKVKILNDIADFKIKLAKVQWKEELLKLETADFKASEGDLKMLRIDKRLQNILAGRGLDENQQMAERIRNQIDHLNENTIKRVNQILEKKKALLKNISDLDKDNEVLENEVDEMEKQENQRENLLKLRSAISDQTRDDPEGKFKQIAIRRKMMDTIEQYREEIEFLNDELDRLRAKTFPSFAHLQAHVDFPDEY